MGCLELELTTRRQKKLKNEGFSLSRQNVMKLVDVGRLFSCPSDGSDKVWTKWTIAS
jgi:hypothetical protein